MCQFVNCSAVTTYEIAQPLGRYVAGPIVSAAASCADHVDDEKKSPLRWQRAFWAFEALGLPATSGARAAGETARWHCSTARKNTTDGAYDTAGRIAVSAATASRRFAIVVTSRSAAEDDANDSAHPATRATGVTTRAASDVAGVVIALVTRTGRRTT